MQKKRDVMTTIVESWIECDRCAGIVETSYVDVELRKCYMCGRDICSQCRTRHELEFDVYVATCLSCRDVFEQTQRTVSRVREKFDAWEALQWVKAKRVCCPSIPFN